MTKKTKTPKQIVGRTYVDEFLVFPSDAPGTQSFGTVEAKTAAEALKNYNSKRAKGSPKATYAVQCAVLQYA